MTGAEIIANNEEKRTLLKIVAKMLGKPEIVRADGTHVQCACGREGCIDLWLSAGDRIFVVSYADADRFEKLMGIRT